MKLISHIIDAGRMVGPPRDENIQYLEREVEGLIEIIKVLIDQLGGEAVLTASDKARVSSKTISWYTQDLNMRIKLQ